MGLFLLFIFRPYLCLAFQAVFWGYGKMLWLLYPEDMDFSEMNI